MVGTSVPWRVFAIPAVAIGLGLIVQYSSRHAPLRPQPPLPELVVTYPAPAPLPPLPIKPAPFDLRGALAKIGQRYLAAQPQPKPDAHPDLIVADGECVRPTADVRKRLQSRVAEWVNATYKDEKPTPASELEIRFGCVDPNGVIVDADTDRITKSDTRASVQRSWVFEITPETIKLISERTSTPSIDWMEWADEGTLRVDFLIDHSAVITKQEHEGGAMRSEYEVSIWRDETLEPVFHMSGVMSLEVIDHQILVDLAKDEDHFAFRCLTHDLKLAPCAIAKAATRKAERLAIVSSLIYDGDHDRELLAEQFEKLHVPAAEREPILAATPETTPAQRAERHVAAFLDARPDGDLREIDLGRHGDADELFSKMRSQLGDTPCVKTETNVDAWVAANAKRDALVITPECGGYTWVAWNVGEWRHEALLFAGERVTEAKHSNTGDEGHPSAGHTGSFFRHGQTTVGLILRGDAESTELVAIANGKVVGKRHGAFSPYRFDPHWTETSDDLVTNQTQTAWFHATPDGIEKIDPELLAPHEAEQRALGELSAWNASRAKELASALRTLGADRKLVAEVAALAP